MNNRHRLASVLIFLGATLQAPGETVTLYREADTGSEVVAVIEKGSETLTIGSTVVEDTGEPVETWFWGEYISEIQGYIATSEIGNDFLPLEGASIYQQPDEQSPELAQVTEEDLTSPSLNLDQEGDWWAFSVSRSVPVYFLETSTTGSDTEETGAHMVDESAAEAPESPRSDTLDAEPETLLPVKAQAQPPPPSIEPKVTASIEGVLRHSRKRFLFFPPKFPLELTDQDGYHLCYVSLDHTILSKPLVRMIENRVIIHGEWIREPDVKYSVIRARNIRPK